MTETHSSDSSFRSFSETRSAKDSHAPAVPSAVGGPTAIVCRKCSLANPPTHRFCRQCGTILWRNCPQCANERPIDELFCAACGADLRSAEQQIVSSCRQQLTDARQLRDQMELHQAIRLLSNLLGKRQHPALEEIRQEAERLLGEVVAERDRQQELAEVYLGRARILMDEYRYREAIQELERIPAPLRQPPHQEQLSRIQSVLDEIDALRQRVLKPDGIALRDRLAAVDRLLELLPHDPQINRWASQIHEHVLTAARKKIREQRYREAAALLQGIADLAQNDETRALLRQANELAFLESELELAPQVNASSLEAARRLLRVDPDNETAQAALQEMTRRAQASRGTPQASSVEWKACPEKTSLGMPVHLYGEPRRLQCVSAELRARWAEHPQQFLVACGLALQALGRSTISIDLTPSAKTGVWGLLRTGLRERPVSRGWGLDLGNSGLKAVRMEVDETNQVRIAQCVCLPHRAHLTHTMTAETTKEILRETLQKFVAEYPAEAGQRVITQWPAITSLTRLLNLPTADGKKLAKLIQTEAQHQIPFPLSEVTWDTHVFPQQESSASRQVLLLAAKLHDMEERLNLLQSCGLEVHGVQCDAVALHNFVHYELLTGGDDGQPAPASTGIAVMDTGSEATNLLFSFPDFLWFRATMLGGDDLVTALARRFKVTHDVAERVKLEPHRVKRLGELYEESSLVYRKLTGQFESAMSELRKVAPRKNPRQLVITGGAALSFGLLRYLRYGH